MAGEPFSEIMEDALEHVIKYGRFGILVDYAGQTSAEMSQGRAASTMEISRYEEVPPNVAREIIEKRSSK
jgi:hypothetical protein